MMRSISKKYLNKYIHDIKLDVAVHSHDEKVYLAIKYIIGVKQESGLFELSFDISDARQLTISIERAINEIVERSVAKNISLMPSKIYEPKAEESKARKSSFYGADIDDNN